MTPRPSRRLRIVTFVNGLSRGGAENALLELLSATRDSFDHSVVSLIAGGPLAPEFRARGIPVAEIGLTGWIVPFGSVARIVRAVEQARADVVAAHMYHAMMAATLARRLGSPRSPLFWTIHHSIGHLRSEGWSSRLAVRVCRSLSRAPYAIVYVSRRAAEQHRSYRYHADNSLVIPNAYNFEWFRFDGQARQTLRAEWQVSDDDIVVGHVAHVHPMKDHANLIGALAIAMAQERRLRAVLCGVGTDRLAIPDELRSRVRLLGLRTDIPQLMSACDVGCLASAFGEAFPNVLVEFLACERPCVTTDVGDAGEIVGPYGRVVPTQDKAALAHALIALSRVSKAERIALGEAGRKSTVQRLAIGSVAARHATLWREAFERAHAGSSS